MRVGIIGAGASGLCAARHAVAAGLDCIVLEQAGELGGTWLYTDNVGLDQYGLPVHSSMYQGLRTNLPKEMMGFPDFPVPEEKNSYVSQKSILNFLKQYADSFGVTNHIKYYVHVKEVTPYQDKFKVECIDVRSKAEFTYIFDSIIACNGHYNVPNLADLNGIENFKGLKKHSHDYRSPDMFKGLNVIVIGAGPSGLDLAIQISYKAKNVYLSHHLKEPMTTVFPENIIQKPDIERVFENEVLFADGAKYPVDAIFYCTGYNYNFPFLSKECKINVNDNYIRPLYKHIVNIEYPRMGFIGIPFYVCTFHMFDLQARFFIASLTEEMKLPSKEEMKKDTDEEMEQRWAQGYTKRQAHMMGPKQEKYYSDLAQLAKLNPIPPVMIKLHKESMRRLMEDFVNYRNDIYKIVDEDNFVRIQPDKCQATA